MASDVTAWDESPQKTGPLARREQLRQKKDGEVLVEMRERVAEADVRMQYQRRMADAWRDYYMNHYLQEDYDDAVEQVVEGPGGEDVVIPAQPTIVVDRITGPAEEYIQKYRDAGLEVRFTPRTRVAPSEAVGVVNGLSKRIDGDHNLEEIRTAAFRDAVLFGYGAYGFETCYVAETLPPGTKADVGLFDQTIRPVRVEFPEWSLLWDPGAKREDKSDAEWVVHRTWMSRSEFERTYPDAKTEDGWWTPPAGDGGGDRFVNGVGAAADPWYRTVSDSEQVAVVVYYRSVYREFEARESRGAVKLVPFVGEDAADDPLPAEQPEGARVKAEAPAGKHRRIDRRTVERIVACGDYVLDRTEVPGAVLPFVPVYGESAEATGEERVYRGLVFTLGDLNKAFENVMNDAVGYIARTSKTGFIGPEGFSAADPEGWAEVYTTPRPFLEYATDRNLTGKGAGAAGPPTPMQPAPATAGFIEALRLLNEDISRLSGTLDVAATQDSSHDRSAQSIIRLNAIGTARHAVFQRNLTTITLKREGFIKARMIPGVYDRPGRQEWVRGAKPGDKDRPVYIRAPYVEGPEGPVLVPCPVCNGTGKDPDRPGENDPACKGHGFAWGEYLPPLLEGGEYEGKQVHYIDLAEGVLDVEVHVGPSKDVDRALAINTMTGLVQSGHLPFDVVGDQLLGELAVDIPALGKVVDRVRRRFPGMHDPEDESRDALMARLTEMQQESAAKDEQIAALQVEADRNKAAIQAVAVQADGAVTRETIKAESAVEVAGIKGEQQLDAKTAEAAFKERLQKIEQAHERRMAEMNARFEAQLKGMEIGADAAQKAEDRIAAAESASAGKSA